MMPKYWQLFIYTFGSGLVLAVSTLESLGRCSLEDGVIEDPVASPLTDVERVLVVGAFSSFFPLPLL